MKPLVIQQKITNRNSETLTKYFEEVNKIPLLTVDEEYEAAFIYQTSEKDKDGNPLTSEGKRAFELLIKSNLRFVISVANNYLNSSVKLVDLINEGNYGLIEAAKRFDPTTNNKFISYAVHWVRKCIISYVGSYSRSMRIPSNKSNLVSSIDRLISSEEQKINRTLVDNEVVELLKNSTKTNGTNYTEKEIEFYIELRTTSYKMWSLDRPLSEDGGTILDIHPNSNVSDNGTNKEDNNKYVSQLLGLLKDEKHKMVIKMYFGIGTGDAMNLKEISEEMSISGERVRQIKDRALSIIKSKAKDLNLEYMFEK